MFATRQAATKTTFHNGILKGAVEPPIQKWPSFRNILVERLRRYPARIGQIDALTGEKDTYREMADRVIRCAIWLRAQTLQAGDIIGVCTYNHLNTFVPLVASVLSGTIVNAWWDTNLNDDTAKYFLNLTKPKIIFADETTIHIIKKAVDEIGSDVKIIALREVTGFETLNDITAKQSLDEVAEFKCKDLDNIREPALILYTSGTSGYPKGALLPYSMLISAVRPVAEVPAVNFWPRGICWATGMISTFSNILACSTGVVYHNATEATMYKIIDEYKVTNLIGFNASSAIRMYRLETTKNYDLSSVQFVSVCGGTLPTEIDEFLMKTFKNAFVMNDYGCTEVGTICLRNERSEKFGSVGQVNKNCEIKLIDPETEEVVGANKEGEVCVKSAYMMLKYYNNPESTSAIFDKDGKLHTGDLAYYDNDGDFFIVDRRKELLKFRTGLHVSPTVIENVILKHPDVLEVGVVGKPHKEDIEQPTAFITRRPNTNVTETDIIDLVAKNLPDHMHLRGGVVILEQLPHTDSGKISKAELRRLVRSLAE